MYEMVGTVKKVGETVTNERGYAHRELVVEEASNAYRPNVVLFTFLNGNCPALDGFAAGMRVKVSFVVNGWEWTMPSGETKTCCKLVGVGAAALDEGTAAGGAAASPYAASVQAYPPLPF